MNLTTNRASVALRRSRCGPSRSDGLTIIELIVTISVAAILSSIGAASFSTFVSNTRLSTASMGLFTSLNYARSEAVKEDATVVVCASADGATCSGNTNWATGWIVLNAAGTVLQVAPAINASNTLSANPATASVTFQSSGLANPTVAFHFCDSRGAGFARDLEVNATGRSMIASTPGLSILNAALTCP